MAVTRFPFLSLAILLLILASASTLFGQTPPPEQSDAVRTHFAAAQEAQQQNDYTTAEREYRAVLNIAPQFAEAHMNLGLVYQIQDQLANAMPEFRRALQLKPKLAGANFFLGVDYCKLGEGGKAIPYLETAVRLDRKKVEIWSWLATAQEMSGQYQAEIATLKHAVGFEPSNVDLLYMLGHAYERFGEQEASRLHKSAPGSARSEQLLAESYATSSHWSSAVAHYQNALVLSPNLPGLHVAIGEVFLRAGKLTQAMSEFEAELHTNPKDLRAIVRRGEAKLIGGDTDGALKDWGDAIAVDSEQAERVLGIRETGFGDTALEQLPDSLRSKLDPVVGALDSRNSAAALFARRFLAAQNGSVTDQSRSQPGSAALPHCSDAELSRQLNFGHWSGLGNCAARATSLPPATRFQLTRALVETGDYEHALQVLNKLQASDQHLPEASYWRARCYEKLATAAYLQLYRIAPDSYRVHQLTGDLEAARDNDRKAIDEYRAAIAMKPSVPNLHYSLGHLLWKDLHVAEARQELQAELAINPHHAGALHDLGNTYLSEHQPDKALPFLQRALAADPGDNDIHADLGTAYSQLEQYGKAESQLKVAVATDRDGSTHYKLARVYQKLGRKEDAAHEFAVSLQLNRASHENLEKRTQRLANIEGLPQ
jgi:tetratricopeptide (TPR) repeat protein